MSSTLDYVDYVCDQMRGAGEISYKKMFGEYGVYCNDKFIGVICDNQLYIKNTEAGALLYPGCEEAPPYEGAKPHFLIDKVDDYDLMSRFIAATYQELPMPRQKKKKGI